MNFEQNLPNQEKERAPENLKERLFRLADQLSQRPGIQEIVERAKEELEFIQESWDDLKNSKLELSGLKDKKAALLILRLAVAMVALGGVVENVQAEEQDSTDMSQGEILDYIQQAKAMDQRLHDFQQDLLDQQETEENNLEIQPAQIGEVGKTANDLANQFSLEVDSLENLEEARELFGRCIKGSVKNFFLTPDMPKNVADYEAMKASAEVLYEQLPKLYEQFNWPQAGLVSWQNKLLDIINRSENKIQFLINNPAAQEIIDYNSHQGSSGN
ncbi:MAG: hypothetical protein COU22_02760 [Candidatus Komeilibacteria bacterium CG10_big_fil_rev_8_21_14_0_10_41_13]|uniref:Uncharacterized protein n=1 Tax=Candidatus Komeilibacteria bacterium CG10_big_fil_rev_8_21_14_0_10_41_13 TaxID=1974476 RepID=A0A2M6WC19_9BACT|nr:MAG: hypothetical protein COU22_02760 [Candidatus Komeilibacteria bacterium CG10_big_fil_rev_8_21_14_0_10_41_13]